MSKKHQRLETFQEVVRRRPEYRSPSKPLTLRDKLGIWVVLLMGLAVMLGTPLWSVRGKHRATIKGRVENWGRELNLLQKEINSLEEAEFSFHGGGNPLVPASPKSEEEKIAHKLELLSRVRGDVAPFLEKKLNSKKH